MNKKAKIKISFSKLTGEEVEVDVVSAVCSVIDIPENATILHICFSPEKEELCPDCYVSSTTSSDEEEWSSDYYESEDDTIDPDIVMVEIAMHILRTHSDFPDYAAEKTRLRSFDGWPKALKQTPQQLSEAGFFYTQKSDRVICFCCGGGLCAWDEKDCPWEQHALNHGECDYLKLMKGPEYIATVKEKLKVVQEDSEIPNLSTLFEQK